MKCHVLSKCAATVVVSRILCLLAMDHTNNKNDVYAMNTQKSVNNQQGVYRNGLTLSLPAWQMCV